MKPLRLEVLKRIKPGAKTEVYLDRFAAIDSIRTADDAMPTRTTPILLPPRLEEGFPQESDQRKAHPFTLTRREALRNSRLLSRVPWATCASPPGTLRDQSAACHPSPSAMGC